MQRHRIVIQKFDKALADLLKRYRDDHAAKRKKAASLESYARGNSLMLLLLFPPMG